MPNVLHISTSDVCGGASIAAYRIHQSINATSQSFNYFSSMRVSNKITDDCTVVGGKPSGQSRLIGYFRNRLQKTAKSLYKPSNSMTYSLGWPMSGLGKEIKRMKHVDVINLHCLLDNTISVSEIGNLRQPIIWTLHDMWPLCGSEHYLDIEGSWESSPTSHRFVLGYSKVNRPRLEKGIDLNRITWNRKLSILKKKNISLVCPSTWMYNCALASVIAENWSVYKIPTPINIDKWKPINKNIAREILGLPTDKFLILFGASGGISNPRKGFDLLVDACNKLSTIDETLLSKVELVIFGQSRPNNAPRLGFKTHYLGPLRDIYSLRLVYSASDIYALVSRQDNFPNTGVEAHACGTPIIAFNTTGLSDLIDHNSTGFLIPPFDTKCFAQSVSELCFDKSRIDALSSKARNKACLLWSEKVIASQYSSLYNMVLA
jgi:glycosyltransferase involved in cell wall biosynthesis